MKLPVILSTKAILPWLDCPTKKNALRLLSAHAEPLTGLDADTIFDVLMQREQAVCTGVGGGAAIPQGRFENLTKTFALFATLEHPVEFGAADGEPVDLIFVLLSPVTANTEHLKSIALASRLLRNKELCQALRLIKDAGALYALLTASSDDV